MAAALMGAVLHPSEAVYVLGDLEETFIGLAHRYGVRRARWWYRGQVARSLPAFLLRSLAWSAVMLAHYLTIALRTLRRQAGTAALNVFGLALGLAVCLLIALFVRDELSYDRFHEHADRLYLVRKAFFHPDGSERALSNSHALPLGPVLAEALPDVEQVVRYWSEDAFVRPAGGQALEASVLSADPAFLQAFTFPLLAGDPATALRQPDGAVLTEEAARVHFGTTDVVGRAIEVHIGDAYRSFTVTGVARSLPANSSLTFDVLIGLEAFVAYHPFAVGNEDDWGYSFVRTAVLLRASADPARMDEALAALFAQHQGDELEELRAEGDWPDDLQPATYRLLPFTQLYLAGDSSPIYSYVLAGVALIILLIACINFTTLAIGRAAGRSREVGVRKAMGAMRGQLMGQFWGEALLMSLLALGLGLLIAYLLLPSFNAMADKNLQLDMGAPWVLAAVSVGLVLMTTLLAGGHPALVLSGLPAVETLKRSIRFSGTTAFAKTLIVVQFALSVFLLACMLVMTRQIQYMRARDMGFDTAQVAVVSVQGLDGRAIADRLRQRLAQEPRIESLTATSHLPAFRGMVGYTQEHEGVDYQVNMFGVDAAYLDVLGLELTAGRNFDPNRGTDSTDAVLVNEALVRAFEIENPIGKPLQGEADPSNRVRIVGVVEDYHAQALYQAIGPVVLKMDSFIGFNHILVRLAPGNLSDGVAALRDAWETVVPEVPFEVGFLDNEVQQTYAEDRRWTRVVQAAALLAVVIACLGLFGLAALAVAGRTKEIGIRKVLGATVPGLTLLVAKDFLWLVGIGTLIAAPAAFLAMRAWLENFAFRIDLGPAVFAAAGVLALLIAAATVSVQSIRAARANPAESLRYE